MFSNIEFANPGFLYLLVLVSLLVAWYWFRQEKASSIQVSGTEVFENTPRSYPPIPVSQHVHFRLIAISLLIIAFARPQSTTKRQNVTIEGIDIVLGLDISGSMLAQDLKPDRLEAAKNVARNFSRGGPTTGSAWWSLPGSLYPMPANHRSRDH